MKTEDRMALIYGMSLVGAAGVSYWRGRRGGDLFADTVLHGAIVGTGINLTAYFVLEDSVGEGLLSNPVEEPGWLGGFRLTRQKGRKGDKFGSLSDRAVKIIGEVTPSVLSDFRADGVTIAPVPADASVVVQER